MANQPITGKIRSCEACGNEYHINPKYSRAQAARSRFCSYACSAVGMMGPREKVEIGELLGGFTRFGKLTLIGEGEPNRPAGHHPQRRALMQCDCGNVCRVSPSSLKRGKSKSCGCQPAELSRARFTKHGGYRTREYKSWNAMSQRCLNPNSTGFENYGGRGIKICDRWQGSDGFLNFVADMGPRPRGMTLERNDSNGDYTPENTRWATPKEQQNNRRVSVLIAHEGQTMSQTEWAEHLGLSRNAVSERLRAGWDMTKAVTTPPQREKPYCPRGHPYSGDNLYVTKEGWRQCRTCQAMRSKAA